MIKTLLSDMEIVKFLSLEPNKFEREIFIKIKKCELNVFYLITRFKYPKGELREALKKRMVLFRDIEFSEDDKSFRLILPRPETYEEAFDKAINFAKNMYLVHKFNDEVEEEIKKDPVIQAAIEKSREKYKRR